MLIWGKLAKKLEVQEHWALEKGTSNTTPAAPKVGPITAFLGPISRSNSGFSRSNSGFSRSKSGCANLHGFWTRNPGLKFRVQQTRISGPVNQDFGSTYPNFGSKNPNFGSTNPDFGSNNQNIGFTVLFFAKLTNFFWKHQHFSSCTRTQTKGKTLGNTSFHLGLVLKWMEPRKKIATSNNSHQRPEASAK